MLKRKITERLNNWKNDPHKKPLVIKGVRQCGKTFSVIDFARRNYSHVIYINFFENPEYASLFSGSLKVDDLVMYMSALLGTGAVFEEGQTIIILDEIQHCPNARTSLKFFRTDGRYDVIATGSLLGVSGYGDEELSIPVGYEEIIEMFPLDFEEFLWANGISDQV
ncbi:MAG: AAA family ATPase, partial [Solobacterium sp.]|nr:AAA family ATPase [Solobacterium sp.]